MDNDVLHAGGDVTLERLELINGANVSVDLKSVFTEIELYEDIMSHSLSGSIVIVDVHDLMNKFPIVGEETLKLEYKTSGFKDEYKVSLIFKVYKLSNFEIQNPHKQSYTLHFTTLETMVDLNKRLSKAYKGTADQIIKKILAGIDGLGTAKPVELDTSSNIIKFVSPFWTPFKCINYATSRAQSVDSFKASNFTFFETNKKYKFKSINNIFDKNNTPKIVYNYNNDMGRDSTADTSVRDVAAEMSKIYKMNIDTRFDMIARLEQGMYSHFVWDHNLLLKTLNKRYYSYATDFTSTNHLAEHPVNSGAFGFSKNTLMSSISTYPQVHTGVKEDNYGKIITNKMPLMAQLESYKLDLTVHGRTDLEVGDLVWLNIGGMEVLDQEDRKKPLDNTYNGRYIVLSILHRITIKKHQMILQVARESVKEKIGGS
jgi:hypothetical protein